MACAAVLGLAVADGGFFPSAWGWATVALAWAALAAVLLRERVELSRAELGTLALLTGFALWTLLSALWAPDRAAAVDEALRALLYLAGLGALLLAARAGSPPWVAGGVVAAAALVGALNLLRDRLTTIDPNAQGAFSWPIGYDNGLAVLLAIGIVVAAGLVRRTRGGSLLAVPLLVVPLVALDSRATWLALAAGLAAAVAARRRAGLAAVLVLGVAAAFALGWRESMEREAYWRVAGGMVADAPLLGAGAGSFADVWEAERPIPFLARDAHSLYLETLAETGPLALLLLVAALVVPLAGAARLPAAAGGYAAFLVHAAVDWDWELPAVALAGLACGAALLVAARPPEGVCVPRAAAAAAAVALGVAGLAGLAA